MNWVCARVLWAAGAAAAVGLNIGARAQLEPDLAPPVLEAIVPLPETSLRELDTIEVRFSEPVQGVDAADLLVNGNPATNVVEVVQGQFVFTFPTPPDGPITVQWRADHGISDWAVPPNPFLGGAWSYTLDSVTPPPGVMISEFMAWNRKTLHDEDGDSSDWIEVYNSEATTVSLEGWFLTDDPARLAKWRFPNVSLAANSYLVVFASEKDRTNATGRLHTNFRLGDGGEYLALVSPRTNVVSVFGPPYPKHYADVSYGRTPGAPDTLGYFLVPTPGAPNSSSGPGFAPPVEFSAPSGPFLAAFDLALLAPDPAGIRFTLDGTIPTNTSPVYVQPLRITNSVQVRARAFQSGLLPGPPRSESYLLLSNNVLSFTSSLPVLVIDTFGKSSISSSRAGAAHLALYEPIHGATSLTNPPTLTCRAGVRIRGSSTEGLAKSSFAVETWDDFNNDTDYPLLGLPAESDWVLYAPNIYDPVMIHNPFVHQLSRDVGQYSPRTRFLEVYLVRTAGPVAAAHYNGIYVLEEKIKIGRNRVAIDTLEPENATPPSVTGGYLLKIDRLDPGDSGFSGGGQTVCYVDPKEKLIKLPQRDPQEQYLKNHLNDFGRVLNGASWRDPNLGYAAYMDVAGWIDFHVLEVLSGNVDALVLSTYFHKPRSGKLVFGPHWDFDRALGSTDGRDANPRVWNTGPFFTPAWWTRLFRDPDFWQRWVDRWQELRASHLSLTNMHALIDRLCGELREAQPREKKRWAVALRGGSYQSEINLMKNWVSNRVDFIDKQLTQPPRLDHLGGSILPGLEVRLAGPAGATIYYTTDGADPRLSGGDLSPRARVYATAIRLDGNARIVARARNLAQKQTGGPPLSTPWSAPVAATYVVTTPALVATELMFHPSPPPPGSTNTAGDFEFIELVNTGLTPLALPGFKLTGGIEFTFTTASGVTNLAPAEHVLVVKNLAAFRARYPGVTNLAGEYLGHLGNGGDRLALSGPLGEPIWDFAYSDAWAPLADGLGFSLVLRSEATPFDQLGESARWRLSARPGGSPGAQDPPPPVLDTVWVNEALSNPDSPLLDAIELYNPGEAPVDLSGWLLTDDFRTPAKYRIPDGTRLEGHDYIKFDETQFGGAGPERFGLSSQGDEVFLFSADPGGLLTGFFHGFRFGPAEKGVSFGRVETSDGLEHFVAQRQPTLERPNAGPRVGPIVLSEILYRPATLAAEDAQHYEFIELANVGAEDSPLFDRAQPTNTWRLRGAVDFDFPTHVTLSPGGRLVVVGFAPAEPAALDAFRLRYGMGLATPVLGPWSGRLDNRGESIRLEKPGETVLSGLVVTVAHVLVEAVDYSGQPPWPVGPGVFEFSLQRRAPAGFANEPLNWFAGPPNPGDDDADADGMPDLWETAYNLDPHSSDDALDDADHDGQSNLAEFLAGTSPRDPQSRLELDAQLDGSRRLSLRFLAAGGRTYGLEYKDSLADGAWRAWTNFAARPSPGMVELNGLEAAGGSTRFFRLISPASAP